MKVCVFTYGCRVNQYESDAIARILKDRGYEVITELGQADVYVVNTCAVTSEAERKSRQSVSRIKKLNPNARIIICGCASQKDAQKFEKDGVKYISGTANKSKIADYIECSGRGDFEMETEFEECSADTDKAKVYLKIQDGCNNFCSYCIIPYLRGRSRSRDIRRVIEEVKSAKCEEVVLTGINLSAYGKDIGTSLTELIRELKDIDKRISLGSLEVGVVNRDFLQALKGLKDFCPHFHLSLQSGADAVLKKMNRKYVRAEYLGAVDLIKEYFPDPSITTDVIVGFPTESEEDFEDTLDLVQKCSFADLHIFPYSKRDGTVAYKLGELDGRIVGERVARLESLRDDLRKEYRAKFLDRPCKVLIEEEKDGVFVGYSQNYIRIYTKEACEIGKIVELTPTQIYEDGLFAEKE